MAPFSRVVNERLRNVIPYRTPLECKRTRPPREARCGPSAAGDARRTDRIHRGSRRAPFGSFLPRRRILLSLSASHSSSRMATTSSGSFSSSSSFPLRCFWVTSHELHHILFKLSSFVKEIKTKKPRILSFFDGFRKISLS